MGEGFVASSPVFLSVVPFFESMVWHRWQKFAVNLCLSALLRFVKKMPFNGRSGKSCKKVHFLTFCKLLKINVA